MQVTSQGHRQAQIGPRPKLRILW